MGSDLLLIIGFSIVAVFLLWWRVHTGSTMRYLHRLYGCHDLDAFISGLCGAVSGITEIRVMGLKYGQPQPCFFTKDGLLLAIPPYGSVVIPYGDFTVCTRRHLLSRLIELRVKGIKVFVMYLSCNFQTLVELVLEHGHLSDEMLLHLAGEQR